MTRQRELLGHVLGASAVCLILVAVFSCGGGGASPVVTPPDSGQPASEQPAQPQEYPAVVWDALARIPAPVEEGKLPSYKHVSVALPHSIPGGKPYDGNSGWILKGNADTTNPNNAVLSASTDTPPDDLAWIIYQVGDVSDTLKEIQLSSTAYNGDAHYGVAAYNYAFGAAGRWEPLFWDSTPDATVSMQLTGADFLSAADNLKFVLFCYNPVQLSLTQLEVNPALPALNPPTGLSATDRTERGLTRISWSHPASGPTPDGYKIFRCGTQNGTYTQIGTVSYPATQYDDSHPSDPAVYWYRAKSYKAGSDDSAFSNTDDGAVDMRGDWSMFRREPTHNAQSLYTGPGTNEVKWMYPTDNWVQSSPAIGADGTVYVGSDKLYVVNSDGTLKWTYATGDYVRSSPAIGADGTIYVGCDDFKLYAINPDSSLKWTYITGDYVSSSPAVDADGTVYLGSDKLYAVNPDGTLKWSYITGNSVVSSPAIGTDGTVYVGSYDNKLYALHPNGTLKWSFTTGSYVRSSPAIGADGTVYVGSGDHKLYAINSNGTSKWTYTTGNYVDSSPAIGADGVVYVGSQDNKYYAINPDGSLKWSKNMNNTVYTSPAIGANGTTYVVAGDTFFAINPNGSTVWSYSPPGGGWSSPAIGANGTVYAGYQDGSFFYGKLYAFGSSDTLNAPTSLTASDGAYSDKAQVLWTNPASGPTPDGYKILRSATENGTYIQIGSVSHPTNTYTDTSASQATTYWYKAISYKTGYSDSADSDKDGGWRNLAPPTGVTASDGNYGDKVLVYWNAVSGAIGYDVYRSDTQSGTYTKLNGSTITGTSYDDTSAVAGTTYWYKVKTKCALGDSAFSAADSGYRSSSGTLDPPTNVSASDGVYTGYVYITWTAPGGIQPDGYKVYRSTTSGGTYSQIGSTANTSYSDTGATPGTQYYYKLTSYKSGYGDSGYSGYDGGWRKLSAPTGVSASDGTYTDKVQVSWNGVVGAEIYIVYRANSSGGTYEQISTDFASPFDDTGATPGSTYWYKVQAHCTLGDSALSAYDSGYRGTGGGGTWQTPVTVKWNGDVGEHCSLALVSGTPAITYYENGDIKFTRSSTPYGLSETDWSTSMFVDEHPWVAPAGPLLVVDGYPAVLNKEDELHYIRASNATGSSWDAYIIVDSVAYVTDTMDIKIAAGNPSILFNDWSQGKLFFIRATDSHGNTWGQKVSLDSGATGVLENAGGYPCVAYVVSSGLKFIRALDIYGQTWVSPILLDSGASAYSEVGMIIAAGNPAVIYTKDQCYFRRANNAAGTDWPGSSISLGFDPLYDVSVAVIAGKPAVAWCVREDYPDYQLWYKAALTADGSSWGEAERIDSTAVSVGSYRSLAEINDCPAIAYYDAHDGNLKFTIKY
jgi:outer membrane protein assembly factor BamB/fibronectin type 3 domain-containing protein